MAGQGEQRVALLRLHRVELTVFPAEARKKKKDEKDFGKVVMLSSQLF